MYLNRITTFGQQLIQKIVQNSSKRNINYTKRNLFANITSKDIENIPRYRFSSTTFNLTNVHNRSFHSNATKYGRATFDNGTNEDDLSDLSDEEENQLTLMNSVPGYLPRIPIIATNFVIFPKFMKLLEIQDPALIKQIHGVLKKGLPYAAVFLRKDLKPDSHTIENLNEVHPVGVFVKLEEISAFSNKRIRLVAVGQRRVQLDCGSDDIDGKKWDKVITSRLPILNSGKKLLYEEAEALYHLMKNEVKTIDLTIDDKEKPISERRLRSRRTKKIENVNVPDIENIEEVDECDPDSGKKILYVITRNAKEEEIDIESSEYKALSMEIVNTIRDIVSMNQLIRDSLQQVIGQNLRIADDPAFLADLAAALTSAKQTELQEILEEKDVSL